MVVRTLGTVPDALSLAVADPESLRAGAAAFTDLGLARAIDAIAAALAAIREGDEPRMTLDLALLRAASPQLDPSREALAQRLERLEAAAGGAADAEAGSAARSGTGRQVRARTARSPCGGCRGG